MVLSVFETITKSYDKAKTIMTREGLTIPRFYIRYLVELEDFANAQWDDKDLRQALSKANAKSLSAIRQKIRKYNRDFETEIAAYREGPDPVGYVSDEGEETRVNEIGEDMHAPAAAQKRTKFTGASSDEDSDSEWASDSDESSDSDIDFEGKQMEDLRQYFLK